MTYRLDSEEEAKRILGSKYRPPPNEKIKQPLVEFSFFHSKDEMYPWEQIYVDRYLNPLKYSKQILYWFYEGLTFKLADNTTYTPDFDIIRFNGIDIIEIKGRDLQDDASVKFKIAREMWPWFNWQMLRYKDNEFIPVKI